MPVFRPLAAATALCVLAVAFPALSDQSQTAPAKITTRTYDGSQISSDINISCKKLDLSSTGTMSGTCTYDNQAIETGFKDTTIDLDDYAGCDSDGNLSWDEEDFSDDSTGADIVFNSDGTKYLLEATCDAPIGSTAQASTLTVGDEIENDDGVFAEK